MRPPFGKKLINVTCLSVQWSWVQQRHRQLVRKTTVSAWQALDITCTYNNILCPENSPCIIILLLCFSVLQHHFHWVTSNRMYIIPLWFYSHMLYTAMHLSIFFIYTFTILGYCFFFHVFSACALISFFFFASHSGVLHKTNFLTGV